MAVKENNHNHALLLFVILAALGAGMEMVHNFEPAGTVGMAYSSFPCQEYIRNCGAGQTPMEMVRCEQLRDMCRDKALEEISNSTASY